MTESTEPTVTRKPYSGAYRDTLDDPDPEPQAADAPEDESEPVTPEPELTEEDKTWKERYGNLRREWNLKAQPALNRLQQLEAELESLKRKPATQAPETEAEVREWLAKNPDMARIVQGIARIEVSRATQHVTEKVKELDQRERKLTKAEALRTLIAIHPDFPKLQSDPDFIEWLEKQPQQIQDWLYANEDDPYTAAQAIQYYKNEKGPAKKEAVKTAKTEAALVIKTKAKPEPTNEKPTWKASDVAKMRPKDYEKYESEIDEAIREGRFINDL